MSNKRPAFQFYIGDWRKDPGVQALDYEARGVWLEMLLLMHESDDRGRLLLNGRPMPDQALARNLGITEASLKQIVSKIEGYGVASRDPETGALYCRRMVRDEDLRQKKVEAGRKGGTISRPPPKQAGSTTEGADEANGGSSSSTSVEEKSKRRRKQVFPKGWKPHQRHHEKAAKLGLDVEHEAEMFENFHLSKGNTYLDWDRTFYTWLGKAAEFSGGKAHTQREANETMAGQW